MTAKELFQQVKELSNGERLKFLELMDEEYFRTMPLTKEEVRAFLEDDADDWSDYDDK